MNARHAAEDGDAGRAAEDDGRDDLAEALQLLLVRVARAEVNVRRNAGFVEAARLAGNSEMRTLDRKSVV